MTMFEMAEQTVTQEIQEMTPGMEDADLIRRCQQGEKEAYGLIVRKYMQRAYFAALGLTGARQDALDLSQEAFVRGYRAIKRFEVGRSFYTWYYRILRNLALNLKRDRARQAQPFSEIGENRVRQLQDDTASAVAEVERAEVKQKVWAALRRLKPNEREIIILKDFQELSYKEIAELLGCPQGTVMSRLYNARKALRAQLEGVFS